MFTLLLLFNNFIQMNVEVGLTYTKSSSNPWL